MKKVAFLSLFLLICLASFAQKKPNTFPEKTTAGDLDAIYTQEDGADKKILFQNARKYFLPSINPITIAYVPASTGNTTNLGQFVTDSLTRLWYIDGQGRATNFVSDTTKIQVNEIEAMADTSTIVNPNEGDIAYVSSSSFAFRGASAWLVFTGGDDWGTQSVVKDSTLRGDGTDADPLRVNRDSFLTKAVVLDSLYDIRTAIALDLDIDPTNELQDAVDVPVDETDFTQIGGSNVQEALESIDATIDVVLSDLNAVIADYVSQSGSYTNPSWLTALAWSKITGTPTTLTGYGITDALDGMGTANRLPLFSDANTLTNSYLLQDASGATLDAAKYFKQTGGTTLQRPAGSAGMEWYNTDQNEKQIYTTAWNDVLLGNFTSHLIAYGNATTGQLTQDTMFRWDATNRRLLIRRTSGVGTVQALVIGRASDALNGLESSPLSFNYVGGDQYSISANLLQLGSAGSNVIAMQSPIRFLESNSIRSNNGRLALLLSEINASAGTRIAKWQFAEASTTLTTPFFVGLASRSQGNGVVANTSGLNVFGSVFRQTITADTTGALLEAFNLQPTFVENGQTGVTTVGLTYNPTNPAATHYALRLASGMVGIGTLTPTQMLDVNGNARLRAHLFDYSNTSGSTGQVLRRGASGVEWQDENATAAWATITQASPDVIDAGGTEQAVQELALQDSKSFTMLTDSTLRFDIAGKYFITASFSAATDYLSGAYTQAFDATLDGSVVASSVLEYETSASGHQVSRSFYVNVTANQVMKFRIAAGTDAGSVERFNVIIQKVNR